MNPAKQLQRLVSFKHTVRKVVSVVRTQDNGVLASAGEKTEFFRTNGVAFREGDQVIVDGNQVVGRVKVRKPKRFQL